MAGLQAGHGLPMNRGGFGLIAGRSLHLSNE